MLQNRLLLDALAGKNKGRAPVWLMRQAGRYLPEFRALRKKHSFLTVCRTPQLAAEATLMPLPILGVDAAILFSDILVILDPLKRGLEYLEGRGPVFEKPWNPKEGALPHYCVQEELSYVGDAVRLLKKELTVPLIGFAGAPFTVASYLIEGGSSDSLMKTKRWMLEDPQGFHAFLQSLTDLTIDYLKLQVAAGADALQLFDSWANFLSWQDFQDFSLKYMQQIVEALRSTGIPLILFCRGSSVFVEALASLKPAAVSLDWNGHLPTLHKKLPKGVGIQGNLDPDILYAPKERLERSVRTLLQEMQGAENYIFNLGHGLKPDMSPDQVKFLVDIVKTK